MTTESWVVDEASAGLRLDVALARHLDLPRNQIQSWIRSGAVQVAEATASKPGLLLRAAELVRWSEPTPVESRVDPEDGALSILHEDASIVVLDKPPGLTVHPGAGQTTGTLVHRLLARYPEMAGVGGPGRPGIVHRLDKGTSGLIVVARNAEAYRALSAAFSERRIGKRYLAIVHGSPRPSTGTIDEPIGRHPTERKRMTVRADGRPSTTRYRTLATAAGISLIELELLTGRTHQIRVHLKHLRHPIVGDATYGEARHRALPPPSAKRIGAFPRPALHAWRLEFAHPGDGQRRQFEAPLPEDMRALWAATTGSEPVLSPATPALKP